MDPFASVDGAAETKPSIYDLRSDVYHDLHRNEIRLVKLLQGRWSDKIYCQLHHTPLANRPSYKALSYAWGSPRATRPILVNGHQHSVTVNLECALRRLRRIDSDLTLWVDALCINQKNDSERTEQVNLMHDIFAFTEEVVVYLGEVQHQGSMAPKESLSSSTFSYDDSDRDKLEAFRSRCTTNTPSTDLKGKRRTVQAFDIFCFIRLLAGKLDSNHLPSFAPDGQFVDTKYQRNIFEGLRQLLLCRWWNRIWVIQEVVVPKKVTVVYGPATAPWDMFVDAARWDSRNRASSTPLSFPHEYSIVLAYFSRIILDIESMRELWRDGKQTALLPLLRRFSGRQASDARDKVYALLSLARNGKSIVPDYSLSVPTVFQTTVLDVINNTKSLNVLAGDLGRKDRQDLPSWVPDWSAAYDDLDRRRAENTGTYRATGECLIYVQDEGAEAWSGLRRHLGITDNESFAREFARQGYVKTFRDILGTSEWVDWLPGGDGNREQSEKTCLAAIEDFYTARGIAVCLQNHGSGVIRLAGLHVDRIVSTGETAFSDDVLLSVVRSWALLIANHFRDKSHERRRSLEHGLRRTLCADTVRIRSDNQDSTTRRINHDDHGQILTWFLQGLDSQTKGDSTSMFEDLGDLTSYTPPEPIFPSIDAAIRSATLRRTFFITEKGNIGLGPAKIRQGDHLYILLGGQTPFILREAGSRSFLRMASQPRLGSITRSCFNIIGDCYAHGLMDGEAVGDWRNIAGHPKDDTARSRDLLEQGLAAHQDWTRSKYDLQQWKIFADDDVLLKKMRKKMRDPSQRHFLFPLESKGDLERFIRSAGNSADEEQARPYMSDPSVWAHQLQLAEESQPTGRFLSARDLDWDLALIKAALRKTRQLEKGIICSEQQMDKIRKRIEACDLYTAQEGNVYLV